MARISNFPLDDNVGLNDILVGSEYNGIGANNRPIYVTKNYRIGDLSNFFGLNVDTVAVNANKLSSLATFNTDGSLASLQNATISLINTATTSAGFATASSVTAVGSRVDVIMPGGGSTVSEAFANQVFTTTTNSDFAASSEVTEIKSQFTYNGDDINGLASGTIISTAIATAETSAVSTADTARATAETALVATISKVFRQDDAPAVTEPVNSIWYDTNDNNKSYVLVAGTPRVWTYTVDATLATSASVTQVSNTAADINGNLSASHSLMVNAGGAIAGMKVSATASDSGVSTSDVVFLADQFAIKTSSGTKQPFTVSGDTVTIDGTLKIGNSTASSIETKANSATQASDHATIQAGTTKANVGLGNVDDTSDSTILTNAATASNTQDKTDGSVGGWTLESNYIFSGTKQTSNDYSTSGITLYSGGALRAKNFYIANDGSAYFKGILSSPLGLIGGFTIGTSAIYTVNKTSLADNDAGVYLGTDGIALGTNSPFKVTAAGALTAANATITGAITCTSISFNSGVTVPNASVAGLGSFATKSALAYSEVTGLPTLGSLAALDSITATVIDDNAITTPKINAGAIDAGKIAANAITAVKINANEIDATKISSLSFSGKSATFDTGTIGGFTLSGSDLHNGKTALTNTTAGVYVGTDGISLGGTGTPTFKVTSAGALTAASGTVGGFLINTYRISSGGNDAWKDATTKFYATNAGYFSLGNKLYFHGGDGTLTINGSGNFTGALTAASGSFAGDVTASSGSIGGWSINGDILADADNDIELDPDGAIRLKQSGTLRVDINTNTTISNPASSFGANSGENVTAESYSNIGSSGFTSYNLGSTVAGRTSETIGINSGNNVYYGVNSNDQGTWTEASSSIRNTTVSFSITMTGGFAGCTITDNMTNSSVSAQFGLVIGTSSSVTVATSDSSRLTTKTATVTATGTSTSVTHGSTTFTGSFVWPNQSTVYIRGFVRKINISGTAINEPGNNAGAFASNIRCTTPQATTTSSNIITSVEKTELNTGGLLVAKNSSSYFRINRNSDTNSDQFIRSRGHWGHFGNGGFKMYNDIDAYATQFVSKFTARQTSSSGYHLVFQGLVSSTNTNVALVNLNGSFQSRANSYGSTSDERLKENIIDATSKLDDIKRVKIRNFNFIGDDLKQIGVIAQELESIWPGLVEDTEQPSVTDDESEATTVKTVKYSLFGPILVKAMQEQQAIIESQKTLIDNLTERVTALEG